MTEKIEIIVNYSGDILRIAAELGAQTELLLRGYAIITIERQKISALRAYPEIIGIELPKSVFISSELTSVCAVEVKAPGGFGLNGGGVIVGIIDSGIDYTHPAFINADSGTRIISIWDQTAEGDPPEGFTSGAEITADQINAALRADDPLSVLRQNDFVGHGTAVAGIAAGGGDTGIASGSMIIAVKTGSRSNRPFTLTTDIMRAVKYIIAKAEELSRPVAINISYGMNNGSHRGDSVFESYLSAMSEEWKCSISVPTGNEGAAGHHYSGRVASSRSEVIEFFTAPGIEGFYLSLWKNFADIFSIELRLPNGMSTGEVSVEAPIINLRLSNMRIAVIYGQPSHSTVSQEIYFDIEALGGFIAAGLWELRIIPSAITDGRFDVWLPTLGEVTAGTYFSAPSEYATLTIPSTAEKVIRVAGYNDRINGIAEFSGRGHLNDALPNPDLAAPAVGVTAPRVGGGYDTFTGTSFAAPFVTGAAALLMEWGIVRGNDPFMYGERVKAFLRLGAQRRNRASYPDSSFGYGTLCIENALDYAQRYFWGEQNYDF